MIEPLASDGVDTFFDDAPCGFLVTDVDGTIQRVNRTFLAMCGHTADELVGRRRLSDLVSVGGRIYLETHVAPMLLANGQVRAIALELVAADGGRVPVLLSATRAHGADGRPTGFQFAVYDATERRAYEDELLAARTRAEESEARARRLVGSLQQALIPPVVPTVDGLDVAAVYRPAGAGDEVGGDFYDVFQVGTDDWIVAVGDVTGKGVDAAAVTALARYTIRAAAVMAAATDAILVTLNDVLRGDDITTRWCTVALARLTRVGGEWSAEVCHGGQPLTLVVPVTGDVAELGTPGTLLGAYPDPTLAVSRRRLAPGDAMVLYTDGVTEARVGEGFYGEERLRDTLATHRGSANGLAYRLLDDVVSRQSGTTSDDIVIVAVHVPLS